MMIGLWGIVSLVSLCATEPVGRPTVEMVRDEEGGYSCEIRGVVVARDGMSLAELVQREVRTLEPSCITHLAIRTCDYTVLTPEIFEGFSCLKGLVIEDAPALESMVPGTFEEMHDSLAALVVRNAPLLSVLRDDLIFDVPHLMYLTVSGTSIITADAVERFSMLRILDLSDNKLERAPDVRRLDDLRLYSLAGNQLRVLAASAIPPQGKKKPTVLLAGRNPITRIEPLVWEKLSNSFVLDVTATRVSIEMLERDITAFRSSAALRSQLRPRLLAGESARTIISYTPKVSLPLDAWGAIFRRAAVSYVLRAAQISFDKTIEFFVEEKRSVDTIAAGVADLAMFMWQHHGKCMVIGSLLGGGWAAVATSLREKAFNESMHAITRSIISYMSGEGGITHQMKKFGIDETFLKQLRRFIQHPDGKTPVSLDDPQVIRLIMMSMLERIAREALRRYLTGMAVGAVAGVLAGFCFNGVSFSMVVDGTAHMTSDVRDTYYAAARVTAPHTLLVMYLALIAHCKAFRVAQREYGVGVLSSDRLFTDLSARMQTMTQLALPGTTYGEALEFLSHLSAHEIPTLLRDLMGQGIISQTTTLTDPLWEAAAARLNMPKGHMTSVLGALTSVRQVLHALVTELITCADAASATVGTTTCAELCAQLRTLFAPLAARPELEENAQPFVTHILKLVSLIERPELA